MTASVKKVEFANLTSRTIGDNSNIVAVTVWDVSQGVLSTVPMADVVKGALLGMRGEAKHAILASGIETKVTSKAQWDGNQWGMTQLAMAGSGRIIWTAER